MTHEGSAGQGAAPDSEIGALSHNALVAAAPQLMWLNHPDGSIASFSREWFAYTGSDPAETHGTSWLAYIHPEDRARIASERAEAVSHGAAYQMEMRIRRSDGVYRWHFGQVVPVWAAAGEISGWLGMAIDIHARKRSEAALQLLAEAGTVLSQSLDIETLLQDVTGLVVAHMADYSLIDLRDADGTIVRVAATHADPAKQELVGRARRFPPQPTSNSPLMRVLLTGLPELQPHVDAAWVASAAYSNEHRALIDQLAPESVIAVPLAARGKTIGSLALVSTDASHRYDADDLLIAQNLSTRVAQAIENAALYDEAQTAIRVREEFLSIAAHELRTPIAALLGYVYLLEQRAVRDATPESTLRIVRSVTEQGNRLDKLINLLLDVSRLQRGAFTLDRVPLDLGGLLRGAVDEQALTLEQHSLHLQLPDTPLPLLGDEARLRQVVHNLVSNAAKFSPHGGPILLSGALEGADIVLRVRDHGIGVPADAQPHLFEQFYRAANVDPKRITGLGIGLYIVKEIVSRHGGTVAVQSVLGQGTTFTVRLPQAPEGAISTPE